jgi:hypothetical protein
MFTCNLKNLGEKFYRGTLWDKGLTRQAFDEASGFRERDFDQASGFRERDFDQASGFRERDFEEGGLRQGDFASPGSGSEPARRSALGAQKAASRPSAEPPPGDRTSNQ